MLPADDAPQLPLLSGRDFLSQMDGPHRVPPGEDVVDSSLRMPTESESLHYLDQLEARGYWGSPSDEAGRNMTTHQERIPLYVTAQILHFNDIKSQACTFSLRVRLYLLWEIDGEAHGLSGLITERGQRNGISVALDEKGVEKLKGKGISAPQIAFMNEIDRTNRDQESYRFYPRTASCRLDCIGWNMAWDINFNHLFHLKSFPFDHQQLTLELNTTLLWDKYHVIVHAVQYGRDVLDLHEWDVYEPMVVRKEPAHRMMHIVVPVRRRPEYYIWNVIAILFIISLLAFNVFIDSWQNTNDRISIIIALLLTCVALKFTVLEQLPKLTYQTSIDKYMFRTQLSLFYVACLSCAARVRDNCRANVPWFAELDLLQSVQPPIFDRWMLIVAMTVFTIMQGHYFVSAYLIYRGSYRDPVTDKDFERIENGSKEFICYHFSRPFFLAKQADDCVAPRRAKRLC